MTGNNRRLRLWRPGEPARAAAAYAGRCRRRSATGVGAHR